MLSEEMLKKKEELLKQEEQLNNFLSRHSKLCKSKHIKKLLQTIEDCKSAFAVLETGGELE